MITWNDLTADEQEGLSRVNTFEAISGDCLDSLKNKGLIVVGKRQIDLTLTGRTVLAQRESDAQPANGAAGEVQYVPWGDGEAGAIAAFKHQIDKAEALKKENADLEAENTQLRAEFDEMKNFALSEGGLLAIVASWLRGSRGDMDDLTSQNIYNMIAKEQGIPPATITTTLVENAELTRLRDDLTAARAALQELSVMCGMQQGDWAGVDRVYAPEWTHPIKDMEDVIESLWDERKWERGS